MGKVKKTICCIMAITAVFALCAYGSFAAVVDTYPVFSWWYQDYSSTPNTWVKAFGLQHYVDGTVRRVSISYSDLGSLRTWLNLGFSSGSANTVPIAFEDDYVYYFVFTIGFKNGRTNYEYINDYRWNFDQFSIYFDTDISDSGFKNATKMDTFDLNSYGSGFIDTWNLNSESTSIVDGLRYESFVYYVKFKDLSSAPFTLKGISFTLTDDNLLAGSEINEGSSVEIYISSLQSYYDDSGVLPEPDSDDVHDIIQGQLAAANAALDREKQENQSAYNEAVSGMSDAQALFNGSDFGSAFGGLISAISYTGTDFSFEFPALTFPFLSNVSTQAQVIPLKYWIDQIPQVFIIALRLLAWIGLVFTIIHWVKKFISLFDGNNG